MALGYSVWIASNDSSRSYRNGRLSDGCLAQLPDNIAYATLGETIKLIDVLWIDAQGHVAAAFEVEHTTSIYSGILRMLDLALGIEGAAAHHFFLVAPDNRQGEVRTQFGRPAFSRVSELNLRYLPYSELRNHRESIARFGEGLKGLLAISRPIASVSSSTKIPGAGMYKRGPWKR